MAAIERDLLYRPSRNHVADRARRAVEQRKLSTNDYGFSPLTEGQMEVAQQCPADFDRQAFDDFRAETRCLGFDYVRSGRNRDDRVVPFTIIADGNLEVGRVVSHADGGIGEQCSGRIEYAALQNRHGLGCGGYRGTQQQDDGRQAANRLLSPAAMPIARGAGLHSKHCSTQPYEFFHWTS